MAISSKSKRIQYISTHVRYAAIYVGITLLVLVFLNIYTAKSSQELFYKNKESAMIEKCQRAATEINSLTSVDTTTVTNALSRLGSIRVSRIIVTDSYGVAIYDSASTTSIIGRYALLPEIVNAMRGYDVFTWKLSNKTMISHAASPIMRYGNLLGCVYISETEVDQGTLLSSLQTNIFTITLTLEVVIILFSLFMSNAFAGRVHNIMNSMQTISEGNYSHRVDIRGNDELTVLGREFNSLLDRLQKSEDTRKQFVSNASHELKTPLASIKLLSDSILQNDMDKDTIYEFVEDIGKEAERLNRMSHKLLSLSKNDIADECLYEIIQMKPTVERVIRMLSPHAKENNISFVVELEDDCPILIADDDLYQIIFNLVENGIKYNTPGGKLLITLRRMEDSAVLCVQDEGMGIPENALPHIFERFYRVDKARSRSTGGSGLGLSIVRELVERHYGKIHVDSKLQVGTTFTVSFPLFGMEESE